VSVAWQFYFATLIVYLGVDIIAVWGLNVQYGIAGIGNFAFIVFQAAGAYTMAMLTLGRPASEGFQQYLIGAHLPFPLAVLAAGVVGAMLSVVVGVIGLRRLRADYQAMVFLVVSLIATSVVDNVTGLANGPAGLSLIPKPLAGLGLGLVSYDWFYAALTAGFCVLSYVFVRRVTGSPLGRTMRAARDNEHAAAALGKSVFGLRMTAYVFGGALAAVSGALLVGFIGAWSPDAWLYPETFVLFTAIVVGGAGNDFGVAVGALLVPIVFLEATRYIPEFAQPGLVDALQWVVVGLLALAFLWFRPDGVIPERRRRAPRPGRRGSGRSARVATTPDPMGELSGD
jgi:branched-chain amino acid transport system permease protein